MNPNEFLSNIKSKGARCWGASNNQTIEYANINLQQSRHAMLPMFIIELYKITSGINLGNGYIFGPCELPNGTHTPIPSIMEINNEIRIPNNKTIFGRNDLFWFAFDAFGVCYMLNNLNLNVLKKYDDPMRALYDCLIAGKI